MNRTTEKIIVGIIAVIAATAIIFLVHDVFSITNAMLSPQTSWKGGVPGTLSSEQFPVVGSTVATPSNSLEWSLPGTTITLLVADTPAEQEQGLGDISYLAPTSGMFFSFPVSDNYGFWMKGMEFPLDIIWLDKNFRVIHVENDLLPSTYPNVFYPGGPAKYVVEVSAGTAQKFSLRTGETLQIYQK